MTRGTTLKFSTMAYVLRAPDTGDVDTSATAPVKPDHVDEVEWDSLSESEREALTETDEGEGANLFVGTEDEADDGEDDGELDESDLDGLLDDATDADAKVDDTVIVPDTTDTDIPDAGEFVSDADLLSFRAVVADSEVPLTDEIPATVQAKLDALEEKFEEGDIDARAYRQEQFKLSQEITRHQIQQRDFAKETKVWQKEVAAFVAARPEEYKQVDANGKVTPRSAMLWAALCNQTDVMNQLPEYANKSGMQVLIEADKVVRQALGIPMPCKKTVAATVTTSVPKEEKPSAMNRAKAKTLTNVPVADANQVGNPLSAINNLRGAKLEKYLESLTPVQRAALEEKV